MPTTIFFEIICLFKAIIIGGGPQWLHGISNKRLAELSNEAERVGIAQFLHEEAGGPSSMETRCRNNGCYYQ